MPDPIIKQHTLSSEYLQSVADIGNPIGIIPSEFYGSGVPGWPHPLPLPFAMITSVDQITVTDGGTKHGIWGGWSQTPEITWPTVYQYETNHLGVDISGGWILATSGGNAAAVIQFTVDGTTPSVSWKRMNACKINVANPVLSINNDGNFGSTAADLARVINDPVLTSTQSHFPELWKQTSNYYGVSNLVFTTTVGVADLLAANVSISAIMAENVTVSELIAANVSIPAMISAGVSVTVMMSEGVTISQLSAGLTYAQIRAAGVSITAFIDEGISNNNILAAGFTQAEIDIALTNIKIHTAFTIKDGAQNESAFATDAVYTPATFAAKLNTDLGYAVNTITAGGDLTTTDSTPYYRLYLQFANAVTLTNMPKYIFNIPFSDFSVKAGGQVNFRNVSLDAAMVIDTSYNTTSNSSTIPAGNYFINDFVSTIGTDLNFTLSYDEPNKRIEFVGLAQDISMNITSSDTTIFDTSITEITTAVNTLPFITYGQPDPTLKNYSDNGITISEFISNGYTIPQLYKGGVIPDWTFDTDANHFNQSYVKDFIDISGSLALRENANLTVNGNIETKGNITIKNPTMTADLSLNHNMVVIGDISMNGNVTVGDISMNGNVFDCSFTDHSIPEAAFNGTIPGPDYTQPTIIYEKGFDTIADVSMNGNVQISKLKVYRNIEFNDGTTMNTYDDNIESGTLAQNNIIFKASTFTSLDISGNLTAASFSTPSDYRIKTDISQLDETTTLDNLRPVKYLQTLINKPQYGLIAHELQEYYPDLVVGEKDGKEWQRVNYTGLIALLINEIKQLKRELTELENGM